MADSFKIAVTKFLAIEKQKSTVFQTKKHILFYHRPIIFCVFKNNFFKIRNAGIYLCVWEGVGLIRSTVAKE